MAIPYRRKTLAFAVKSQDSFSPALAMSQKNSVSELIRNGVKVTAIMEDHKTPMKIVYDPGDPDADEDGYVTMSNVNTVTEITDLIDASRVYEANITAFNATKNMLLKGFEIVIAHELKPYRY